MFFGADSFTDQKLEALFRNLRILDWPSCMLIGLETIKLTIKISFKTFDNLKLL
jgi:hypothetical protein